MHTPITQQFAQIRSNYPKQAAITLLHATAHSTVVAAGNSQEHVAIYPLPFGLQNMGDNTTGAFNSAFRHNPPTPLELENAIVVVEDAIMPLARSLPHPSALVVTDSITRMLQLIADSDQTRLGIDAIEDMFRRLAEVAEGRPMQSSGLPMHADFAAAVLIVREFMHHLGFDAVMLSSAKRLI